MSGVDLEAIRRRANNDECGGYHSSGSCDVCDAAWIDRDEMLAEVERLRAELDGVRADREALDAENQRLRKALLCVERAPDGFDGAIIPEWLERMVSAALRGSP